MLEKFAKGNTVLVRQIQDILANDQPILVYGRAGSGRVSLLADLAERAVQPNVVCTLPDYEPVRERVSKPFTRNTGKYEYDFVLIADALAETNLFWQKMHNVMLLLNCQAPANGSYFAPHATQVYAGFDGHVIKTENGRDGSPIIRALIRAQNFGGETKHELVFEAPKELCMPDEMGG